MKAKWLNGGYNMEILLKYILTFIDNSVIKLRFEGFFLVWYFIWNGDI